MLKTRILRVGTRGSSLALAQTHATIAKLRKANAGVEFKVTTIQTRGDRIKGRLSREGGKGLFVKEIEDALLDNRIDLAVHSMKDVPTVLTAGLAIGAVPRREDPRDTLVSNIGGLDDLPPGAKVATGSLRRGLQLKALRPDLRVVEVRGNVDTRLKNLDEKKYDAVVLAVAGLSRLGLKERIRQVFSPEEMTPSVGQGALAIEIRADDDATRDAVRAINHSDSEECVFAEHAFLRTLGGSCNTPIGGYATLSRDKKTMDMVGVVAGVASGRILREWIEDWEDNPAELGEALAEQLMEAGGEELLNEAV